MDQRYAIRLAQAASLLLAFLACGGAFGQRLLVRTTGLTATGEAARAYMNSVDMALGKALPGPEPLPGARSTTCVTLSPDSSLVVVSSQGPFPGGDEMNPPLSFLSAYNAAPFLPLPLEDSMSEPDWRLTAGPVAAESINATPVLSVLGAKYAADGTWQGRLDMLSLARGPSQPLGRRLSSVPLPGVPVAAATLPPGGHVAVLCRGFLGSGAYLHTVVAATGEVLVDAMDLAMSDDRRLGSEPVALSTTRDGQYLLALTTGYALDRPSGSAFSALYVWRLPDMSLVAEPLELPGMPQTDSYPLRPADGSVCWVVTHVPGEGFAYATRVEIAQDSLRKTAEPSFSGVAWPPLVSPAPTGRAVAIAVDHRLDIRPDGLAESVTHSFESTIRVVSWTQEGLFVGEGGRVHTVDPASGSPISSVQLQNGVVTGVILLPAHTLPTPDPDADGLVASDELRLGTKPESPDSDEDGIHDGADPEPSAPSPRVDLPAAIVFRAEAAGRELHALLVKPARQGYEWRLAYNEEEMPWLSVYPRGGHSPVFYLGIDPSRYQSSQEGARGLLTVHVSGTAPSTQAYGSPARIELLVRPERSPVRRVLWLLDGGAPGLPLRAPADLRGLKVLAECLTGPPHYFSNHEAGGPYLQSLEPYAVVVLTAEAALHGAVTRQAVLDYVARGGGLLFLGSSQDGESTESLSRWLSPIGIHLAPSERVEGTFSTNRSHWISRFWKDFRISNGCGLRLDDRSAEIVPGPAGSNSCIFALKQYGYGRVAALASATPLETPQMSQDASRQFAEVLFGWLAQAGREIEDLDLDGLPDTSEDRNQNGALDPSETSALDPDTDGDGLPDGKEDTNRNGKVDPGETSPINPDSDGDGTLDGADATPLPSIEAPHVAATEPSSGPAEGGTHVLITGRNLSQDSVVRFGLRRSPAVRSLGAGALFAETPPCESDEGGSVDVRIESPSTQQSGILPSGFLYAPLSVINLSLERIRTAETAYQGAIAVRLESEPQVKLGWITLRIDAEPSTLLTWGDLAAGNASEFTGRQVAKRPTPTGGVWIDISPGVRQWNTRARTTRELAVIRWASPVPISKAGKIRLSIGRARAMSTNGVPLNVNTEGVSLEWEPPA